MTTTGKLTLTAFLSLRWRDAGSRRAQTKTEAATSGIAAGWCRISPTTWGRLWSTISPRPMLSCWAARLTTSSRRTGPGSRIRMTRLRQP